LNQLKQFSQITGVKPSTVDISQSDTDENEKSSQQFRFSTHFYFQLRSQTDRRTYVRTSKTRNAAYQAA